MQLNRQITPPETPSDKPPVLLVHGLLGNVKNLGGLARRLTDRTVIQVDMRNHGDSPWSDEVSYPAMATDLASVIDDAGGTADVVGHSMGGKSAMVLALTRPELVRRLVILDIAPIAYSHSHAGLIEAMEATDLTGLTRRSEADRRLAERVPDAANRAFVLQSADLAAGRWRMNLAALKPAMGVLTGWPDDLPAATFSGPVLAIAGGLSTYVGAEGEAALRRAFPQARVERIPGAGHWVHADAPAAVAEAVAGFLA